MAGYRLNPKQDYTAYFPALLLLFYIDNGFALSNFNMNVLLKKYSRPLRNNYISRSVCLSSH